MGDRQFGPSRGRGRGQSKMRMDDPSLNSSKRKREEEGGDPVLSLLSLVLRIGDRLRVVQTILDCSVEVATKCGLWHADEESIVNMLLDKACEGLNQALATGDRYRARLLLRLLAGLTTANVVSMPSMFATLNHIVSTAVQVLQGTLDAGTKAEAGRRLQPYTDFLVYSAVIALPWLAPELQHLESDPEGFITFSDSVQQYLEIRPNSSSQDALNPFTLAGTAEDSLALGGSGGTSFLPQLWAHIKELKDNQWKLISVASYSDSFEAQLAACKPLDLPQLTVPLQPPGIAAALPLPQAAAAVLQAYPPRGALNLQLSVDKQPVSSLMSGIDRIVIQDYVIDTIHYFDGDNNELARRLGIALPVPQSEDVEAKALAAVVQETIFSQLLRLPESEFGVLAYAKITTNLCKLSAAFAQPIGGCLKALKEGMGSTDPQVALRVADWLALHINNHDFIWSWHRWENVLELPPYHPVRHFVAVALERTMRLSFREFHTQFDPTLRRERVPEALFELLGPPPSAKPVFEGKPLPAPKSDEQQEMTDAEQPVEAAAAQPNKTAAQPNGTPAPSADADAAVATETPAADATAADAPTAADSRDALEPVPDIAQQLYAQVRLIQAPRNANRYDPTPHGPSLSDRLSTWLEENVVSAAIGGDLQLLKWLARCLLTIGGRSIGHLYSYLDRHEPIMNELVTNTGNQGEDLLVEEATSLWANSVQHTALIVDHLMGKRWLSAPAVLRWLFGPKAIGMRSADNAMECLKCTDILYNTVARVLARTQDDREILQGVEQDLRQRREILQAIEPDAAMPDGDQPMEPAEDSPTLVAARKAVTSMEAALVEAQAHMQESLSIQNDVVLQVYKGYMSILEQSSQAASATDGVSAMEEDDGSSSAQDSQKAWRNRTLAALGAFLRTYYMHVASVAAQIEQQLEEGVAEDVKHVVQRNLIL
ncbi:hypothetical protein ABBQ38_002092 [Trebouxia sp. C0009 RCD-2024]